MKKILLGLVCVISFFGCKKGKEKTITPPVYADFFESNFQNKVQTYKIDPSEMNVVVGKEGVNIAIRPNTFEDMNGDLVTDEVTIELIEILNYREMINTGKVSTSNGEILVSGGQARIRAFRGSEELTTNKGIMVTVPKSNISTIDGDKMNLFVGNDDENFDWEEDLTTNVGVFQEGFIGQINPINAFMMNIDSLGDTLSGNDSIIFDEGPFYYFNFQNENLGWINCDYFWDYPMQTSLTIHTEEQYECSNTNTFLVFKSINSVSSIGCYKNAFVLDNLPIGEEAIIVMVSQIDGQPYFGMQPITIVSNHVETISMAPISLNDLKKKINEL